MKVVAEDQKLIEDDSEKLLQGKFLYEHIDQSSLFNYELEEEETIDAEPEELEQSEGDKEQQAAEEEEEFEPEFSVDQANSNFDTKTYLEAP